MRRRAVVGTIAAAIAFCLAVPRDRVRRIFARLRSQPGPTPHELRTMVAVAEHIYPRDSSPGAVDLGIEQFLGRHLGTDYYRRCLPPLRRATAALDAWAVEAGARDFVSSPHGQRCALVDRLASAQDSGLAGDFADLVDLTLEGCFSDPVHGGNRLGQGWAIMREGVREEWFGA